MGFPFASPFAPLTITPSSWTVPALTDLRGHPGFPFLDQTIFLAATLAGSLAAFDRSRWLSLAATLAGSRSLR
jgi:hypothetical protein